MTSYVKDAAAKVGLASNNTNSEETPQQSGDSTTSSSTGTTGKKEESDFHTPGAVPGDSSEREHGKDSSTHVHPQEGSARAPEFLDHLKGGETSTSTQAGSAEQPTQPPDANQPI